MATASELYAGSSGTSFTCTLTSVAANAGRQSTAVSNTTNLYLDAIISGTITTGASAANGNCYILLYGYDGTNYPWGGTAAIGGSDAGFTCTGAMLAALGSLQLGQPVPGTGLVFGAIVPTAGVASGTAVAFEPFSASNAFGMLGLGLPVSFGVVVINMQGEALPGSSAGTIYYNGVKQTIA